MVLRRERSKVANRADIGKMAEPFRFSPEALVGTYP
jgi:hypothetical protein